jgi:carboxymethylenebutenolidase
MSAGSNRIERVRVPVPGGELPLTFARGRGAAAVVIMPSAFGVTPDLEEQMRELADDAAIVVTLDPFFRTDAGPAVPDDMARVMARIRSIDRDLAQHDFLTAIAWTRERVRGQLIAIGICFGGAFALGAAADGEVQGVVTWHGTRMEQHLDRAGAIDCPLRFHFGSVDPVTPPEVIAAIRGAFAGHEDVEIQLHEGATHGFSSRGAPAYDAAAERAAMSSVRELLRRETP